MINISEFESGDSIKVAPLGIECTITYNHNGVISGMSVHTLGGGIDPFPANLAAKLQKSGVIPSRIVGCTSDVEVFGILYERNTDIVEEGTYPYCVYNEIYGAVDQYSTDLQFVAINLSSDSPVFGIYQVDTKLRMFGFEVVSSYSITMDISQKQLDYYLYMSGYPFVSGYGIFSSDGTFRYVPNMMKCLEVNGVESKYDHNGYIVADLTTITDGGCEAYITRCTYTDIIKYNIQSGSKIFFDSTIKKIVYSSTRDNDGCKKISREFDCPYCGRVTTVPNEGWVRCVNEHCVSNLYSNIVSFISKLNIEPEMEWTTFLGYIDKKDRKIYQLSDIFGLDEYSDVVIEVTIAELLEAICPNNVRRFPDFFQKFVQNAGSMSAVRHYLTCPDDIAKDMKPTDSFSIQNFVEWISDPFNLLNVNTILDDEEHIHIRQHSIEFDNVPQLFRNKNIYLAGSFKHGSYEDIVGIVTSYGAEIVNTIDNRCDCVVLGSFSDENDNSLGLDLAVAYRVPIFAEDEFFDAYGIDKDIEENISE